jgi:hypothetical protein
MIATEITEGRTYVAKVSGRLTTVRVDGIRHRCDAAGRLRAVYDVTNLRTGRRTTFASPTKFRRPV